MTSTTLNPDDKTANITLSGSNLVATASTSSNGGVRAADAQTSGKYYFEITWTATGGSDTGVGFCDDSCDLNAIGSSAVRAAIVFNSGNFYVNGSNLVSIGAPSTGTVTCIAVDLGAQLIWARQGSGNWNDSGTANPATGTGGESISALSGNFFPAISLGSTSAELTANFGATSFAQTVPSGFTSGWPTNPISSVTTFNSGSQQSRPAILSNGNLTATYNSAESPSSAVAYFPRSSGKFYIEYTQGSTSNGGAYGFATTTSYGGLGIGDFDWGVAYNGGGGNVGLFFDSSVIQSMPDIAAGDVIGLALDLDNMLIWARLQGGDWNGSSSANPTTATGGASISGLTVPVAPAVMVPSDSGASVTANLGGSLFAHLAPAGFTAGWPITGDASGTYGTISQTFGSMTQLAEGLTDVEIAKVTQTFGAMSQVVAATVVILDNPVFTSWWSES